MKRISNIKQCRDFIQSKLSCCYIWRSTRNALLNNTGYNKVQDLIKNLFNENKFFNDFIISNNKCPIMIAKDNKEYLYDILDTINAYMEYANKRISKYLILHNYPNEDTVLYMAKHSI